MISSARTEKRGACIYLSVYAEELGCSLETTVRVDRWKGSGESSAAKCGGTMKEIRKERKGR